MATLIQGDSFGEIWLKVLKVITTKGQKVAPRDQKTLELTNVTIDVSDGLNNILLSPSRNLNYRFMIAEWLWIQAGLDDVESISTYNKIISDFSDDGISLTGAYGPRLKLQWKYIFENLKRPYTRQAVASIWTPSPDESKDVPCTLTIQWFIRDECVDCTVNMRSSDAWLGLPYDFFNFSQLTNVVAASFELPVGSVTMNLGSSHLYERHWSSALYIINNGSVDTLNSPLFGRLMRRPELVDLKSILLNPGHYCSENWPWLEYSIALGHKTSAQALEELRGISLK